MSKRAHCFAARCPPETFAKEFEGHEKSLDTLRTHRYFSELYKATADNFKSEQWWSDYSKRMKELLSMEDDAAGDEGFAWPAPYVPHALLPPPTAPVAAAGFESRPAIDPVLHAGRTKADMEHGRTSAEEQERQRTSLPIEAHESNFCMVWWEAEPGSESHKNAELAGFKMPLCLAEMGTFDRSKSADPMQRIPIKRWYLALRYDETWRPWRIKTADGGKNGTLWGGTEDDYVLRRSVRVTDLTFNGEKVNTRVLDKKSRDTLKTTAGSEYSKFSKHTQAQGPSLAAHSGAAKAPEADALKKSPPLLAGPKAPGGPVAERKPAQKLPAPAAKRKAQTVRGSEDPLSSESAAQPKGPKRPLRPGKATQERKPSARPGKRFGAASAKK